MIQEQLTKKITRNNIYNFMDFKKKKPFFRNYVRITLGNPINATYYMVKNMVFKDKQILALKTEEESQTIVLVEATIVDGQLTEISSLSDDVLEYFSRLLYGNDKYSFNPNKCEIYTETLEF